MNNAKKKLEVVIGDTTIRFGSIKEKAKFLEAIMDECYSDGMYSVLAYIRRVIHQTNDTRYSEFVYREVETIVPVVSYCFCRSLAELMGIDVTSRTAQDYFRSIEDRLGSTIKEAIDENRRCKEGGEE